MIVWYSSFPIELISEQMEA